MLSASLLRRNDPGRSLCSWRSEKKDPDQLVSPPFQVGQERVAEATYPLLAPEKAVFVDSTGQRASRDRQLWQGLGLWLVAESNKDSALSRSGWIARLRGPIHAELRGYNRSKKKLAIFS